MTRPPPFRIVRPLGKGGMASVFEVALPDDPRRLAAKVLAARSPTARERFRREGEVLARLRHPHVVAVHGSGELEDGRPYLLLDLVDGRSLTEHLARAGPLPVAEALRLAREVAAALAAAHGAGVVHRDVKPDNVLLDAAGRALLTDFGIALALDQERLTRTGQWAGTLHYMAPEQLSGGERVGPPTDVYAVGALLYELLAGERPFDGDDVHQLAVAISTREPPPLRTHRPDVPAAIAALVHRCLEKEPRARHPDAGALLDDLDRLVAGGRPATSISGVALGVRRALRRRHVRALAALALLLAAGGAVASTLGDAPRARGARGRGRRRGAGPRPRRGRGRDHLLEAGRGRPGPLRGGAAARARRRGRAPRRGGWSPCARPTRAPPPWRRSAPCSAAPGRRRRRPWRGRASARPRARGDDVEVEAARAWLLLTCGDAVAALEAARRRRPSARRLAARLGGDAGGRRGGRAGRGHGRGPAGGGRAGARPRRAAGARRPGHRPAGARARLQAPRPADDAARAELHVLADELAAAAADARAGAAWERGPGPARPCAEARLRLGRLAGAAAACAAAAGLLGPDPGSRR
ncbi:MAG: serine/threonine protein kinase [Planctomycetes bacterium]|nr:serine/threonine protein kinase [Planctomycetota bacterium]